MDVKGSTTTYGVKVMIQGTEGIPANMLHLSFASQELENGRALADYNITDADVLTATVQDTTGGGCLGSLTIASFVV